MRCPETERATHGSAGNEHTHGGNRSPELAAASMSPCFVE
jgi:hypothetical protein